MKIICTLQPITKSIIISGNENAIVTCGNKNMSQGHREQTRRNKYRKRDANVGELHGRTV